MPGIDHSFSLKELESRDRTSETAIVDEKTYGNFDLTGNNDESRSSVRLQPSQSSYNNLPLTKMSHVNIANTFSKLNMKLSKSS